MVTDAKAAENSWQTLASMPTERHGFGVAVVNGKIYAIGGYNYGSGILGINEEYDPATNTWATKKSMPTPRSRFGIAVYQNKIYIIGGEINTTGDRSTAANEVYDPMTDTWEIKASMPTPRYSLDANVVSGKIYLIGGFRYIPPYNSLDVNEVYDPATDSWTTKTSIPNGVQGYASAVVDNKIYVIGGAVGVTLNQIYDTKTDTWSYGTPIPTGVDSAAAGATTGVMAPKRIYVIGGKTNLDAVNLNQVYNPETDTWSTGASMPTSRFGLGVAVVNDVLYAIGGVLGWWKPMTAVNEQYTPYGFGTVPPPIDRPEPPAVYIISPENKTYTANSVCLTFTVNEPTSWIGYSLDGQANVTITGNITLMGLSDGSYSLKVFANDTAGNMGSSETVHFTISHGSQLSELSPTMWIAVVAVTATVVGAGVLVYFTKIKKSK